jgi:t-SNARE complex subunit (syntaxin)
MSAEAERSLRQSHRQLLVDLTDLHQEVGRAENTMYDLAQLQARLAQTLQEQDHVIEQIQANADTAQHNVDSGNEELTAAMKYQRDFRWGVLLFFLILSLTLLALDVLKGR